MKVGDTTYYLDFTKFEFRAYWAKCKVVDIRESVGGTFMEYGLAMEPDCYAHLKDLFYKSDVDLERWASDRVVYVKRNMVVNDDRDYKYFWKET